MAEAFSVLRFNRKTFKDLLQAEKSTKGFFEISRTTEKLAPRNATVWGQIIGNMCTALIEKTIKLNLDKRRTGYLEH